MGRARFTEQDFLQATLRIAAERGPAAVTVGSITERLKAPTGSFYHRFASRNVVLAELWLWLALDWQNGIRAALDAGDALGAALHTPAWVRTHLDEGLVLLYPRQEFIQGDIPDGLRRTVAAHAARQAANVTDFARLAFGQPAADARRRAEFLLLEVPVAAVTRHLRRHEPPPPIVDELIAVTYHAVLASYRARNAP